MTLTATDQALEITQKDKILAGTSNYYSTSFTVDNTWAGFTLSAVFQRIGGKTYKEDLDANFNSCYIPEQVIKGDGWFVIGLFGSKVTNGVIIKKTTNWTEPIQVLDGCQTTNFAD